MMIQAKGPVWHQKQKLQGIIPPRLRGLDKDATWSFSQADGWVYGHGSFCLTSHRKPGLPPLLGRFVWMPNSAHEGKRLLQEMPPYRKLVKTICMDSKADDLSLYNELRYECSMLLLTKPRAAAKKNSERQQMIRRMNQRLNRNIYRQRSTTVEPMQALVKDIFSLERCWMRGDQSNRWLFAAMGIAIQIAQRKTLKEHASTWKIKQLVLGR